VQVYVASDSLGAREVVSGIVRGAGFTAVDLGGLTAARVIEDIPVAVFPSWRVPFIINIVLFVFLYALSFAKFQVWCASLFFTAGRSVIAISCGCRRQFFKFFYSEISGFELRQL
jgi:hypothetical protein